MTCKIPSNVWSQYCGSVRSRDWGVNQAYNSARWPNLHPDARQLLGSCLQNMLGSDDASDLALSTRGKRMVERFLDGERVVLCGADNWQIKQARLLGWAD